MATSFRDVEHLIRLAAIFAVGLLLFVVARLVLVPDDFGVHGHYRAGALDDARDHPPAFAGFAACAECHDDIVEARAGGGHDRVRCEACHGALGGHAEDPTSSTPELPDGASICLSCHVQMEARPAAFPTVHPEAHAGGDPCTDCHMPHAPKIEEG